jgi:predicted ABC-type ATPase
MKRIIIIASQRCRENYFRQGISDTEGSCPNFINADLIAGGLSPFKPAGAAIQAGRLMILEMRRHPENGESFAFETTLSGRSYAQLIPRWQSSGYRVELTYLKLRSVKLALARINARVAQGDIQLRLALLDGVSNPAEPILSKPIGG